MVSDHVAEQVLEMARRYFSDPENVKKYEAWHSKGYGLRGTLPPSNPHKQWVFGYRMKHRLPCFIPTFIPTSWTRQECDTIIR